MIIIKNAQLPPFVIEGKEWAIRDSCLFVIVSVFPARIERWRKKRRCFEIYL